MSRTFSVEQVAKILNKNIETVRRYIREGIATEADMIKLREKSKQGNKKLKDHPAINNNIDILKNSGIPALCIVYPSGKNYKITYESLVYLLKLKNYISDEASADDFISKFFPKQNKHLDDVDNCLCSPESVLNHNSFIIPASPALPEVFCTDTDKELFFKGLYCLENIDGSIVEAEQAMLKNRMSLLNISKETASKWIEDLKTQSIDSFAEQVVFSKRLKAVHFILECLFMAWQDKDYQPIERELILKYVKANNINEASFQVLEEQAEVEYTKTIANALLV